MFWEQAYKGDVNMSIKKKFVSVVVAFVMAMCFSLTCGASVFAVTLDETGDAEVSMMDAIQEELPAGEEVVAIAAAPGVVSPCANAGPIAEEPSSVIVCNDGRTVQGSYVTFYLTIPSGKTVNKIGYSTTVAVLGLGTSSYRADLDGIWYRISDKGLKISGGKTIAVELAISDSYHPYNVMMVGCS